jgi:ubiquinone/menaquinone biosynthesis C-methylase UbiE
MSLLRRLSFNLWYLRRPPWDRGIVPPEVQAFMREHPVGRALDLGCGTGTSSLALARAGWQVTGIDFAVRAIRKAKQKARHASLPVDFRLARVTCLPRSLYKSSYDLVLDIGCFHSLTSSEKASYLAQLDYLVAPGGTWLLYGFFKANEGPVPGLIPANLENIHLQLVKRQDGLDKNNRSSAWFWLQKYPGSGAQGKNSIQQI